MFCTGVTLFTLVLHLNCTALSQSESRNFFMCIIRWIIMARIFHTLLSKPSGFRPSRCTKIFQNVTAVLHMKRCTSSRRSQNHIFLSTDKKITKVKWKCLKFCVHQISSNVMHVVVSLCVTQSFFNNVAFRHIKSLQNDPVIF